MNRAEIEQQVNEILKEQLGSDIKIEDDSSLTNDLGADSLDSVEVIMHLESKFKIAISDDDSENIKTPKDLYDAVETRLKKKFQKK